MVRPLNRMETGPLVAAAIEVLDHLELDVLGVRAMAYGAETRRRHIKSLREGLQRALPPVEVAEPTITELATLGEDMERAALQLARYEEGADLALALRAIVNDIDTWSLRIQEGASR